MIARLVLVLFAALVLASCTTPCNCTCTPKTEKRLALRVQQFNLLSKAGADAKPPTNVVVCDADKNCEIPVQVFEGTDPNTKQCWVKMDYCTLCVRGAAAKPGGSTQVTWKLTLAKNGNEATDYYFDENTGVDVSWASVTGKDFYGGRRKPNKANEFVWRVGPDQTGKLPHEVHVYRNDGVECLPWDPDLINSD